MMLINLKSKLKKIFFLVFLSTGILYCYAQKPTAPVDSISLQKGKNSDPTLEDTIARLFNPPKIAAIRSAILPGLGQVYNKKYWKLPIIYGALGLTGYVFFDNTKTYKEYKFAYAARINAQAPTIDSTGYNQLKDIYKVLTPGSIRSARDQFRRYIDYSVLVFMVLWGLNVMDAAVDAHLKSFDVSPDLSLQIKPGHSEMANTNGLSLILNIGKNHSR
jgi:hypothetical protein